MMYQKHHTAAEKMHMGQALDGRMSVGEANAHAFTEAWFEHVFQALDRLHDSVCANGKSYAEDALITLPVAPEHMVGWLEDMIYTAQETIREIRASDPGRNVTIAGTKALRLESEGSNGTQY